jgi:hypothetical protein
MGARYHYKPQDELQLRGIQSYSENAFCHCITSSIIYAAEIF